MNERTYCLLRLFFIIFFLLFSGCASIITDNTEKDNNYIQKEDKQGRLSVYENKDKTDSTDSKKFTRPVKPEKLGEQDNRAYLSASREGRELREEGATADTQDKIQPTTEQELLDSALGYCQASNDFWEQGDLDNSLLALDKAYSLLLEVNGDISPEIQQQKDDIRITISKRIVEVYSSRFTVANGTHKAIPLVMNEHIEKELNSFKGREKNFFLNAYKRSGRYRPFIVQALKNAGLPEELSWLPLIESGFNVRALSKARALGMWQFIASTGYKYGLKRDTWIDERMHPEKSTLAAIEYLTQLHHIFGDWTTALAAYNCGERRVLNVINSQKINYLDNFWDLYKRLPSETAFYVPRFLAVLHIVTNPEAHGIELPELESEFEYEEVTINKQVHLETIAKRLDITYSKLRELNPELRQNLTPKEAYSLNVPVGKGETLLAELKDIPVYMPPTPPAPHYIVHKVKSGETLSIIAQRHKTSVAAITSINGLKNKNILRVGQNLKIPSRKGYTSVPATASSSSGSKGALKEYIVMKGDSLWNIAQRYNTTVNGIKTLNKLKSSGLQVGQVLYLPMDKSLPAPGKTERYEVKKGDSPFLIAKRYSMNLSEFLKLNNLTPKSTIFPGQLVEVMVD
ncbi:MAG: LysM peptidoglycan-binding domain-containing protein [Deltaproteobacteria bacterium]|nr:LysM peptidoglycan-binding domain-containing protein [Deltaproteobacteria bacterium]